MTASGGSQQKSFLASLFDFGFTSFVTLRFLKVIYAIWVVLILIAGAIFLVAGLSSGTSYGILGGLIFAPIITFLYLIGARIFFEIIAMFFRIGDNTFMAVQLLGGKPVGFVPPGQAGPVPYGAPAPGSGPWGGPPVQASGPQGSPYPNAPQQPYGQGPDDPRRQYPDAPDNPSSGPERWQQPPSNQ
jgi:hypothetical protein